MNNLNPKPVAIGIIFALLALLAGTVHGMAFGANEGGLKQMFRANAEIAFAGKPDEINNASKDAWKMLKRAHYHFMGLGAAALAMCLLVSISTVADKLKMAASTLAGFGAFLYPCFFLLASFKTSHAGKHAAKESLALVAQAGAMSFLLGLLATIAVAALWALSGPKQAERE